MARRKQGSVGAATEKAVSSVRRSSRVPRRGPGSPHAATTLAPGSASPKRASRRISPTSRSRIEAIKNSYMARKKAIQSKHASEKSFEHAIYKTQMQGARLGNRVPVVHVSSENLFESPAVSPSPSPKRRASSRRDSLTLSKKIKTVYSVAEIDALWTRFTTAIGAIEAKQGKPGETIALPKDFRTAFVHTLQSGNTENIRILLEMLAMTEDMASSTSKAEMKASKLRFLDMIKELSSQKTPSSPPPRLLPGRPFALPKHFECQPM